MKKSLVAMVTSAVLLATGATMAQDTKSPPPVPKPAARPAPRMDANMPVGPLDEQIKKMQSLHDRMAAAATPAERQKLMEEQRKSMHEGMAMMNQMMQGGAMMGGSGGGMGGAMGGGMGGGTMGQKGKPADAGTQMQMMQRRMDMMQMMMQSMMDQTGPTPGPGGTDAAPKR